MGRMSRVGRQTAVLRKVEQDEGVLGLDNAETSYHEYRTTRDTLKRGKDSQRYKWEGHVT